MKTPEQWLREWQRLDADMNCTEEEAERQFCSWVKEIQEDARAEVLEALSAANKIIEQQADENKRTCARAWEEGRSATYNKFIEIFIPDAAK